MNFKYFILLYVTCFINAINSIEDEEITYLWNAIKGVEKDYINSSDLFEYYRVAEDDFQVLTLNFGTVCKNDKGKEEAILNLTQFTETAIKGYIPRWPTAVYLEEFKKIASEGPLGLQITYSDMKTSKLKYNVDDEYSQYYTSEEVADIMTDFGVFFGGQRVLFFFEFIRAVNTDSLLELDLRLRLCVLKCKGSDSLRPSVVAITI